MHFDVKQRTTSAESHSWKPSELVFCGKHGKKIPWDSKLLVSNQSKMSIYLSNPKLK